MGNLKIYINCLCGNCVHQIFGIVWYCLMWFYEVEIFQDRKEVEADLVVDVTVSGYDHRITIQACTGLTWPPFPPSVWSITTLHDTHYMHTPLWSSAFCASSFVLTLQSS